jgi:hypothetical protein
MLGLARRYMTARESIISEGTVTTMRFRKGLLVGMAAMGLVGCSGAVSGTPSVSPIATARTTASSVPPASPQMKAGARAAAAKFYGLYSTSQFAVFWNLLAPTTKRQIPRRVWVSVHEACPSAAAGKPRVIKAVTVFGDAAIVTEAIVVTALKPDTAEDVFNYADGHWSYSLADLNIYRNGSVAADIAAAKAAGFCTSWKIY